MATYMRTGRISWSPLTDTQRGMLAQVAQYNVGEEFTATLDTDTEAFLIGEGVIASVAVAVAAAGLASPNIAELSFSATLDSTNGFWYRFTPDDFAAAGFTQTGTDFSVGTANRDTRDGALFSVQGGVFQAAVYVASQYPTFDNTNTKHRYLWLGLNGSGGPNGQASRLTHTGLDLLIPLMAASDDDNGVAQATGISTPIWSSHDDAWYGITFGEAMTGLHTAAIGAAGTDSIPVAVTAFVYQIA